MKISFTGLSDKSFVENNTVGKGRIWRRDSGEGVDVYITKSPASAHRFSQNAQKLNGIML